MHEPHGKHRLLFSKRAPTGLLHSSGCPIVERLCYGNVFTDPLPSNGYKTCIFRSSWQDYCFLTFTSMTFCSHICFACLWAVLPTFRRYTYFVFIFHLGGSVYFRDANNTASIHTVKIPSTESTSSYDVSPRYVWSCDDVCYEADICEGQSPTQRFGSWLWLPSSGKNMKPSLLGLLKFWTLSIV
jgi:hypothetical protein